MSGVKLKTGARRLMFDNAPKLFLVSIVFIIIVAVFSELQFRLPGTLATYDLILERLRLGEIPNMAALYSRFRPPGAALAFVLLLLKPVVEAGYISYCMKITRGQPGEFRDIMNGFQHFTKVLSIAIISAVFIALWSLLFFFPGIVASYRYRQAYYILLDDPDKSAMQCIRESKWIMAGNKVDLFLVDLSFIGWVILDFLVVLLIPTPFSVPIVSIWMTPYMGLTHAAFYERLLSRMIV